MKYTPEIKTPLPGPKAKAVIEKDHAHSSPSYIKEYPLVIDRGEGSFVWDIDGNRFLDFMTGIAVTSTGHCHPQVVKAITEAAHKFLHICGSDFYYETFSLLVEKLSQLIPAMGPKKVFLTNSGTEAIEGALKLSRAHTRRSHIISFRGSFHGRSLGAVSISASKVKHRAFYGPLLPNVHIVAYPYPLQCPCGQPPPQCDCARKIETELFAHIVDPREVAAIFVEPILGEGGYVVPPLRFLKELRRICDENKILLVFDEVQTGIGRTGEMFAAETFGVTPDIICTAKGLASGLPIGAIIAKESVMTWERGTHGSTFGGNPVSCAAALATLEIVKDNLSNVKTQSGTLIKHLKEFATKFPIIKDVRGVGLMVGLEFETHAQSSAVELEAFHSGLLTLTCGKSVLRLIPPLTISNEEIKLGLAILQKAIEKIHERRIR